MSVMRRASSIWPTVTLHSPIALISPARLQRRQRAHARRQRHARIDDVELVEIDRVDAEGAATALARRGQVLGPAVGLPAAVRPREAALGGHGEARAIAGPAADRPREQPLVVAEVVVGPAVGVGGVEEGDAGVERGVQHRYGSLVVAIRVGRQAHAADGDHGESIAWGGAGRDGCRARAWHRLLPEAEMIGWRSCEDGGRGQCLPHTGAISALRATSLRR